MSEVNIPFRPEFHEKILLGTKTMTCRSKRMGEVGDLFKVGGQRFVLTQVFRTILSYVVRDAYEQEGCDSPGELIAIWEKIHPAKGYEPDSTVWAHCWMEAL